MVVVAAVVVVVAAMVVVAAVVVVVAAMVVVVAVTAGAGSERAASAPPSSEGLPAVAIPGVFSWSTLTAWTTVVEVEVEPGPAALVVVPPTAETGIPSEATTTTTIPPVASTALPASGRRHRPPHLARP